MITDNRPSSEFEIQGRKISSNSQTYFIADIAANHDGDLSRAKDLIYLAAESGADAVKFQHFTAETIVSDYGFKSLGSQQSHQSTWKKSVFDVYKDASVKFEWTAELCKACADVGIPFFTTPYELGIVDQIDEYVPAYKIGSGDITWLEMIEKVASKGKPIIIASGASTADEVNRAISCALSLNPLICLMQCNTNYTASPENFKYIQLNVLKTYRSMYPNMILGLSDHTPGHSTVLGSVALGARMIEKHFTDDISRNGPDHRFSMDPKSWREMIDRTRELEAALGNGIKKIEENEVQTVILQRRALRAKKHLPKGYAISNDDFLPLRPCPGDAFPIHRMEDAIGKVLNKNLDKGDYLKIKDFE